MADQEGTGGSQADTLGQQSQADTSTHGQNQTGSAQDDAQSFDAGYVKTLRSEAASWRTKAQQAQKRLEEIERGQMSEFERLKAEHEAVKAERDVYRQQARAAQVVSAAVKAGAIYPDAVAKLVADDADDMDAALKEVRKQYPALFRAQNGSADAGAGTNGRPPGMTMNDLIRGAAGRG